MLLNRLAASSITLPAAALAAMLPETHGGAGRTLRARLIARPELDRVAALALSRGVRGLVGDAVAYLTRPDLGPGDLANLATAETRISVLLACATSRHSSPHLYRALATHPDNRVTSALLINADTPLDALPDVVASFEATADRRHAYDVLDELYALSPKSLEVIAGSCRGWRMAGDLATHHMHSLSPAARVRVVELAVNALTSSHRPATTAKAPPWDEYTSGYLAEVVRAAHRHEQTWAVVTSLLGDLPVTFGGQPLALFVGDAGRGAHLGLRWVQVMAPGTAAGTAVVSATLTSVVATCGEDAHRWAALLSLAPDFDGTVGDLLDVISALSTPAAATTTTTDGPS